MLTVNDHILHIEKALSELEIPRDPVNLYEPLHYMLAMGGKRIRPALTLLACDAMEGDVSIAVHPALCVELFHNFSLVHDDIMDNAPIRRNRPTVHERWNRDIAILTGDVLLVQAYAQLERLPESIFTKIFRIFNTAARQVCEGQQLDMDFQHREKIGMAEYMHMIQLKTAVLLGCALQLGAVCAHASDTDGNTLYETGVAMGLAFQLMDDYLDTFGNHEKFGKKNGGDIVTNKKTFLYVKCLEKASEPDRRELLLLYDDNRLPESVKVKRVTELFTRYSVGNDILAMSQHYTQRAYAMMDALACPTERKKPLKDLADSLLKRNY